MTAANSTRFDSFDVARFWSKVAVKSKNQCWLWLAGKRPSGHGDFQMPYGATYAHRFAYSILHGELLDGVVVRHKCDNPSCCNPNHLELGTHQDNVADRVSRNRSAIGIANGRAKLTLRQAREIKASSLSLGDLAQTYQVSRRAIDLIKRGINWKSA